MIKTFCDRCGKEVTEGDKNYANENRGHEYRVCSIGGCDLCKNCIIALQEFMKGARQCEKA